MAYQCESFLESWSVEKSCYCSNTLCCDFTVKIHLQTGCERVNSLNVKSLWCISDVQGPVNSCTDKLTGALPCLQMCMHVCMRVCKWELRESGQPQGYMPLKIRLHKFRLIIHNNDSPVCWLLVYPTFINMLSSWCSFCKMSYEWEWGRIIKGHMEMIITCWSGSIPDPQHTYKTPHEQWGLSK